MKSTAEHPHVIYAWRDNATGYLEVSGMYTSFVSGKRQDYIYVKGE